MTWFGQVCRDHKVTGSTAFLRAVWPAALDVMTMAQQWDTDGDGLIENSGFPDQVSFLLLIIEVKASH
jgi:uncharacterized protein (DUF608 family)